MSEKNQIDKYLEKQDQMLRDSRDIISQIPDHHLETLYEIENNIKDLREEAKDCKEDDLAGIVQQLNLQYTLADRFSAAQKLPDISSPYFGHMKIDQNGKHKHIFLGHRPFMNRKIDFKIVDWKKAPIARIFYQSGEGDSFDFDLDDRTIEGTILEKSILTIRDGKLLRVDRNGEAFVKRDGQWTSLYEEVQILEGGEGKANQELQFGRGRTNFESPEVLGLLDKLQYEIVNKDMREPLLITGGAGSGKTTVALYRIAKLCEKGFIKQRDALILVPNTGLIKLSETLLSSIGMDHVHVKANDYLIRTLINQNIKGLTRNVNYESPLSVMMIKKHRGMLDLIKEFVLIQTKDVEYKLSKIDRTGKLSQCFNSYYELALIPRLREVYKHRRTTSYDRVQLKHIGKELKNFKEDLLNLYSNNELMKRLNEYSGGHITHRMIEEFKMYTAKQIASFDDDGDYQESKKSNGFFDIEDYPVLALLKKEKMGNFFEDGKNSKLYKHIFIDEAQELCELELKTIAMCLRENGSYTVAGDAIQQIDPSRSFSSWENVLESLGVSDFKANELNVSYRSPKEIIEFAHKVLGPLAPRELPESKKSGGPVLKTQVQHREHASMVLSDALVGIMKREPRASVAIICNKPETAREFYHELADIGGIRLVLDQDFSFRPGVDITTTDQIRGLEFDYVIIPDADRVNYNESSRSRKRLHLAVTRAIHQLWIMYPLERTVLF